METIKIDKLKEKIINHLIVEDYNLHQGSDDPEIYTVYTPYNKNFIIAFYKENYLITVFYNFAKFDISKKKLLKLVNDLNTQSYRMKFSVDSKDIIQVEARVQRVCNKKSFQNLLDDIEYDISILFTSEIEKYI